MNLGYARNTDTELPHLPHLQIVDQQTFEQVQKILDQRSKTFEDKRTIARQTKSKNLLSGIMFCAHCGGRLTSLVYREKYERKDGTIYDRTQLKYLCYHKSRGLCQCDGQSTYVAERVDKAVIEVIHQMFDSIKGAPSEEVLQKRFKKEMSSNKAKQTKINLELKKNINQLERLQDEIAATLTGDSVYSAEQLSSAIKTVEDRISTQKFQLEQLQNEVKSKKASIEAIRPMFEQFVGWAQEFDKCTIEQKKMIISQLVNRIELNKDYELTYFSPADWGMSTDDNGNPYYGHVRTTYSYKSIRKTIFNQTDSGTYQERIVKYLLKIGVPQKDIDDLRNIMLK